MKKVLVIHPFGIGDVIFSFPLVHTLKQAGCQVDFLCNERTINFVACNPDISNCLEFNRDKIRALRQKNPFGWLRELHRWIQRIKAGNYDGVFDLSMGRDYAFFSMLAGVRKRIGFNYKNRGRFLTDKISLESFDGIPVRSKVMELLKCMNLDARLTERYPKFPPIENEWYLKWRQTHPAMKRYAVLAPGGGASWGADAVYKQWLPERFAEVGRELGTRHQLDVLITGSPDEAELVRKVADQIPNAVIVIEDAVTRIFGLLQHASLFVGNDGGLLHLADLAGASMVGIYGPVSEVTYGPTDRSDAVTVFANVKCRPCYAKFIFPVCEHEKACQTSIATDEVLAAVRRTLNQHPEFPEFSS